MAEAALAYLAEADLASEPADTQADCLRGLARVESLHTVARSVAITAFSYSDGYLADGQYSVKAWLRWQTQSTSGAAGAAVSWARRLAAHPAVQAAAGSPARSPHDCMVVGCDPAPCTVGGQQPGPVPGRRFMTPESFHWPR